MFIEYWNNPNMIFFLIALFVAMMCYSSAILWKRARLYEVAYTLGTARRQPIKPLFFSVGLHDSQDEQSQRDDEEIRAATVIARAQYAEVLRNAFARKPVFIEQMQAI